MMLSISSVGSRETRASPDGKTEEQHRQGRDARRPGAATSGFRNRLGLANSNAGADGITRIPARRRVAVVAGGAGRRECVLALPRLWNIRAPLATGSGRLTLDSGCGGAPAFYTGLPPVASIEVVACRAGRQRFDDAPLRLVTMCRLAPWLRHGTLYERSDAGAAKARVTLGA